MSGNEELDPEWTCVRLLLADAAFPGVPNETDFQRLGVAPAAILRTRDGVDMVRSPIEDARLHERFADRLPGGEKTFEGRPTRLGVAAPTRFAFGVPTPMRFGVAAPRAAASAALRFHAASFDGLGF